MYIINGVTENIYDDSSEFDASTIYGILPNQIIGSDGLLYRVDNTYCFNRYGQGLKIEEISGGVDFEMLKLYCGEGYCRLSEQKLKRVDFVLSEEHSRVMPLAPEDYTKINRMFEQIDAGLYKFRTY